MSNVSAGVVVCPKCGSLGRAGDNLLMSNPPQQPYTCTNAACRQYWTQSVGSAFDGSVTVPTPNTTNRKIVCPKCQSDRARRIGSTLTAPPSPIYGCTACGHEWREVDTVLPKTPAEKALERDEERREERHQMDVMAHKMNVEVMRKQLVDITDVAIHRAKLLHHVQRQTEALEGILRFLRESREEDLNRSRVVMD